MQVWCLSTPVGFSFWLGSDAYRFGADLHMQTHTHTHIYIYIYIYIKVHRSLCLVVCEGTTICIEMYVFVFIQQGIFFKKYNIFDIAGCFLIFLQ